MSARIAPRPYADPYLAGVGLGLVLLASFVLAGRGLGASGAFATVAATSVHAIAPAVSSGSAYFTDHLAIGGPLRDWLVVEILGVIAGGFLSAWLAGRLAMRVERGEHTSLRRRLGAAAGGGALMGAGAVFARGCTSGQALTGGALLSAGAWSFIGAAFAAAYLAAFVTRRSWT